MASELAATPECFLDSWTKGVLQKHPTLDDDGFKHQLHLMGLMLVKDIAPVEARHASIRRILTILSCQTHTLDFADLDSRWVFMQARSRSVDAAPWQKGKFRERARRKRASNKAKAKAKRAPLRRSRGPSGRAGAPRAFIRSRTLGVAGSPDFGALAAAYRAAKAANTEEYRRAVRVGKAGRDKGRAERKAGTSTRASVFGWKGRQIQQHSLRKLAATRHLQQREQDATDPTTAAFAMGARALRAGLSIKECLQIARASVKDSGSLVAQQAEEDFQALQRFRATTGAASASQLCQDLPGLSKFELVPHASAVCPVFWVAPPASKDVTSAVSFAHHESLTTNLSSKLADSWEANHKTIMHSDITRVPAAPAEHISKCRAARVCLCTAAGKELASLHRAIEARLKQLCPAHSPQRVALVEGRIVLRFLFQVADTGNMDNLDLLLELESSRTEVFFHIPLQYLGSVWRSTIHLVSKAIDLGEVAHTDRRIYIEAG